MSGERVSHVRLRAAEGWCNESQESMYLQSDLKGLAAFSEHSANEKRMSTRARGVIAKDDIGLSC